VLQIRTPFTAAFVDDFLKEIVEFIKSENLKDLIILSSAFSHERHFVDKNPFEYISNKCIEETCQKFSKSIEGKKFGTGIALNLHKLASENKISSTVLYKYVSEGDNRYDGIELSKNAFAFITKKDEQEFQVKIPPSWHHFFGADPTPEIY
jgi:hypothetical protein